MLSIKNLRVVVNSKPILSDLNFSLSPGEIHAIMGPNGAGKSTLASVLAGREELHVESGSIDFMKKDLLSLAPEQRSAEGLFLAFQYPVEIPGVSNTNFIKAAMNQIRKYHNQPKIEPAEFLKLMKEKKELLSVDDKLISRSVNEGFSGGEKKKNEIFQLLVLDPKLAILDEIDSGLDVDALKVVAKGINSFMTKEKAVIIITHYQKILEFIKPDFVHVMSHGKIVKSGDHLLAKEIEAKGYGWISECYP